MLTDEQDVLQDFLEGRWECRLAARAADTHERLTRSLSGVGSAGTARSDAVRCFSDQDRFAVHRVLTGVAILIHITLQQG